MDKKVVDEVNASLNQVIDEMVRHNENPRLIQMAQFLARLTDTGENEQQVAIAAQAEAAKAAPPAEDQPHQHQFNAYGRCVSCVFCLHEKIVNGICIVCDTKVSQVA